MNSIEIEDNNEVMLIVQHGFCRVGEFLLNKCIVFMQIQLEDILSDAAIDT